MNEDQVGLAVRFQKTVSDASFRKTRARRINGHKASDVSLGGFDGKRDRGLIPGAVLKVAPVLTLFGSVGPLRPYLRKKSMDQPTF